MVKHAVIIYCEPLKGEADTAVNNWVTNYNGWDGDVDEHSLTETSADGSGTTYVTGLWRFYDEGEQATNILEDLSTRLQSLQGGLWHRLGYHVCDHDGNNNGGCSWTANSSEIVEYGTIPSDIPTLR